MTLLETVVHYVSLAGFLYLSKVALYTLMEVYQSLRVHILPRIYPTEDLSVKYGQWAVVTGAADEMIKYYAKELAKKKVNIVLISRYLKDIKGTAEEIEKDSHVKTKCIAADFRQGKEVYNSITKELENLDVGILVNGVDNRIETVGQFVDNSVSDIWNTIDNGMGSVAMMCSIILPNMVKNRRGKIVNISSMAALEAHPNTTAVDSATKAFTLFLSQSSQYELREFNVQVQTLTPNTVLSDPKNRFMFNFPSPADYAKSAVNAIDKTSLTTGHWFHGILLYLKNNLPSSWWVTIKNMDISHQKTN